MTSGALLMSANRRYPHRFNFDMTAEMYQELAVATAHDRLKTSARLRALVQLWQADPELQQRALDLGLQIQTSDRRPADMT